MSRILRWRRCSSRVGWSTLLWVGLMMVAFLGPMEIWSKALYVIGDEEHPWDEGGAMLEGMDVVAHPGWIVPQQVDPEKNLSPKPEQWWMWWEPRREFWKVVFWDPEEARYEVRTEGGMVVEAPVRVWKAFVDLGSSFGVHSVRFSPESWEMSVRMPAIEVGMSEGDPKSGDADGLPILDVVWSGEVEPWVEAHFPRRSARYVGVQMMARIPSFGIKHIEVYGEGFVAQSRYISPVLDLGKVSDLGRIRWRGERDADAQMFLRTRTGTDEDPHVYWRKTEGEDLSRFDASGEQLTKETYERLASWERGGITPDREHWSPWSAPYPFEEGAEGMWMVSPSPRRYVQIQIKLLGDYKTQRGMDFISFEYSQPVIAQKVLGEITPTKVHASEQTTFHYVITPLMGPGDRGFDALEIFTPLPVDTVRWVRWDDVEIPVSIEHRNDPTRFMVHFPRVKTTWMPVEIEFDVAVLRYGTAFRGRVFDSTVDEVPQWVVPGDAHPDIDSSTLSVQTMLGDSLIVFSGVSPNPFTPNEDGVNDEAWVSYDLLQLTEQASVRVQVSDLWGRQIRMLHVGGDRAGRYRWRWDGKDEGGKRVCPGVYLIEVSVEADALRDSGVGLVSVVY